MTATRLQRRAPSQPIGDNHRWAAAAAAAAAWLGSAPAQAGAGPMREIPLALPVIGADEQHAVRAVLSSGRLAYGEAARRFESEFSARVAAGRPCVALNSGTSALLGLLLAYGIGPGDEVIVPGFTFAATANCVLAAGAAPVLCDIDPMTYCIDAGHAAALVGPDTAAILAVHLYGHPAAMGELRVLADRHGLLLLEDAAQAPAASLDGVAVGALGDGAAFSFHATKNITTGEGGMAVLPDEATAAAVRQIANQGMSAPHVFTRFGLNLRMNEIAAAIGTAQVKRLAAFTAARRAHAAAYDTALGGVVAPRTQPGATHAYHQYTLRPPDRPATLEAMQRDAIECRVYYPQSLDELAHLADVKRGDLAECRRAAREVLSVPVGPHLRNDDVARVAAVLRNAVRDGS